MKQKRPVFYGQRQPKNFIRRALCRHGNWIYHAVTVECGFCGEERGL